MPYKHKKPCCKSGCPELTHNRYCQLHTKEIEGNRKSKVNKERPAGYNKQYGRKWRKLRLWFLKQNPLCVVCGTAGTDVDHILPLSKGGTNELSNLQTLCHSCHSRKTVSEDGGFGNKKKV
ncbi:MAG: HNH endonuclease signature motif containing protein [Proteobacteria bacterium]|nr:HNH endonuclease signature motif containing protein [Pseudomonadota bacterium]MDA0966869.1 HNH endonuclease signature motif containing protein [Pseudomonadota bacterium]